MTAANAAVAQDVIDRDAAIAASNLADANQAAAIAAAGVTAADVAAKYAIVQGLQNDPTQLTLSAYNDAEAQDVEGTCAFAQAQAAALVTSLGAAGSPIDAADLDAATNAVSQRRWRHLRRRRRRWPRCRPLPVWRAARSPPRSGQPTSARRRRSRKTRPCCTPSWQMYPRPWPPMRTIC